MLAHPNATYRLTVVRRTQGHVRNAGRCVPQWTRRPWRARRPWLSVAFENQRPPANLPTTGRIRWHARKSGCTTVRRPRRPGSCSTTPRPPTPPGRRKGARRMRAGRPSSSGFLAARRRGHRVRRARGTFQHARPSERHAAGSWRSPWKTASTLFPSGSMTNAA